MTRATHARSPRRIAAALAAVAAVGATVGPAAAQGRASPLDTATAVIEGHDLEIRYGRPSMRGRVIYGGLVPWGRVWRTGANEATHFRTPVALRIGDARVPAGEYTLFSIPGEGEWTLVINRQTGQWGTAYDASRDLVRVPMRVESLDEPAETLTIALAPGSASDGVLTIEWERTRAILAFDLDDGR